MLSWYGTCRDDPQKSSGHAWNIYVRVVKDLHEPYQALSNASMSDGPVYFAGEHRWSNRLPLKQAEAITTILVHSKNGWQCNWRLALLTSFHKKDRCHTSSPVMPSRMVFEKVWKVATPCGPTYTAISRLFTYLITFLRLVTCKITVLYLLSFNAV